MSLFKKIKNRIKYLMRDTEYNSDILIGGELNSTIIGTNNYAYYCDENSSSTLSSICILHFYDKSKYDFSEEEYQFTNLLESQHFRYIMESKGNIQYILINGSIRDYDRIISYMSLCYECEELIEYHYETNTFLSHTRDLIKLIPASGFKYCIMSNVIDPDDFSYSNEFEYTENGENPVKVSTILNKIDKYYKYSNSNTIDKINIIEYDRISSSDKLPKDVFASNDLANITNIYLAVDSCEDEILKTYGAISDSYYVSDDTTMNIVKIRLGDFIQFIMDNFDEDDNIQKIHDDILHNEDYNINGYNWIVYSMSLFYTFVDFDGEDEEYESQSYNQYNNDSYYSNIDETID